MWDSQLRFLLFTVIAPGQTNDAVAYEETCLHEIIDNLPSGLYVAGDAAYILTEHLLVPFTGSCRQDPNKGSFKFYLSQLRIQIKMAFGLLTTKWQCLRKKLETSLHNSAKSIEACAQMHNYVLDCQIQKETVVAENALVEETNSANSEIHVMAAGSPLGLGYLPTIDNFNLLPGTSLVTREAILQKIARHGFRRPTHNLERRNLELSRSSRM
jgi:hypothetical protein